MISFIFAAVGIGDVVIKLIQYYYYHTQVDPRPPSSLLFRGTGYSASVSMSATVATFEDAYTDTIMFETICHTRGED
jgi:hypothetical protein